MFSVTDLSQWQGRAQKRLVLPFVLATVYSLYRKTNVTEGASAQAVFVISAIAIQTLATSKPFLFNNEGVNGTHFAIIVIATPLISCLVLYQAHYTPEVILSLLISHIALDLCQIYS
jgi:hypothetical protein